jgi:O-antigen/teichoic acid export membrane protein
MKRQFFKHGLIYGAANLLSGAGSILLVPIYTHALRPEAYGMVDYVGVVQNLVQVCAGLEITQGIARFYAAATDDGERQAYASTGLLFVVSSLGAVCLLLYLAGSLFGGSMMGLGGAGPLLGLALLSIYLRILFYSLQGQLRWELRSDRYSLASLIAVTGTVAVSAYLLLVSDAGLAGVFIGSSAGYGLACMFCIFSLRRTYRLLFDAKKLRQMLRFSLPLTVSALALFAAAYGDRILLRSQLGFHELGIYGIAARFGSVVTLAITGFQLGAAPLIYRHFDEPTAPSTLAQLMRIFMVVGAIVVVGLAAFSIEALALLTTGEYRDAWRLIPLLSLGILMASLYTFVPGLTVRNLTGRFAVVNITSAAVTLSLVAGLLSVMGMSGAALGALTGSAIGFVMHAAASQAVYPMPINWPRFAGALAVTLLVIAVCTAVGAPGGMSLALRASLFGAGVAALIASGLTSDDRALAWRIGGSGLGEMRRLVTAAPPR